MVRIGKIVLFWLLVVLFSLPCHASSEYQAENINIVSNRWPDSSDIKQFSEDAIRLMNAVSYEEKAIAIWRFIRMFTAYTTGVTPKEPKLGNTYVDDPLKVLNVYGAHNCDGLSRIMETAWRSLGMRAEKLYRSGHTQADLFWEDEDGITRGHLFDVSEGWFVYDRTGKHIASPDDISLDYSLIYRPSRTPRPDRAHYWGMYNWVHAPHIEMPRYSPFFNLRSGETFKFFWGNLSKPYLENFKAKGKKDFEHGPYPVTYGNSLLSWSPEITKQSGHIYHIKSPYIISQAKVWGHLINFDGTNIAEARLSVNSGKTWELVWESAASKQFNLVDIDLSKNKVSPIGRYDYLLKFDFESKKEKAIRIEDLKIETIVQHNIFSLPQLLPGTNLITVTGTLKQGAVLRLKWNWTNRFGKTKEHISEINRLPYSYKIIIPGKKWKDIKLNYIETELFPENRPLNSKNENQIGTITVKDLLHSEVFTTEKIIGKKYPSALKKIDAYIKNLKERKNIVGSLAGIMVLKDEAAWDSVQNLAYKSIKHPVKDMSVQALFLMNSNRATPVLIKMLGHNPEVIWKHDSRNKFVELQHRYHSAALIGRIFAIHDIKESVPYLAEILNNIIQSNDRSWQPHASIIKSLGMLGDSKACSAIRPFLDRNADEAAIAVWALGELGDKGSVKKIRKLFDSASYELIKLNSAVALCKLHDNSRIPQIVKLLKSSDENFRGLIAQAFGETKNKAVIKELEQLLSVETFPWVKSAAQKSIKKLSLN